MNTNTIYVYTDGSLNDEMGGYGIHYECTSH